MLQLRRLSKTLELQIYLVLHPECRHWTLAFSRVALL